MAVKQTAGRNSLGDLAPKFAELNEDVLFGGGMVKRGQALTERPLYRYGNSSYGKGHYRQFYQISYREC